MGTKISGLTDATSVALTDTTVVVQSGVTKESTLQLVADAIGVADWPVTSLTASATLGATVQIVQVDTTSGAVVLTLPVASTSGGVRYLIKQTAGTATITLDPNGTDQVEAGGAGTNYLLPGSGAVGAWSVYCSGTAWFSTVQASMPVLNLSQAGSAPTASSDLVKFYAVATGGRAEPFVFLEDSEDIPLTRCTVRSITASTFTFDNKDETIFASTASNAITGTLPTPANHTGRMFLVWKTNTGTNKITLARAASESINGVAASYDLPDSATAAIGVWHIICDGTNWYVSGGAV